MNTLLGAHTLLGELMLSDTRLALAYTAAWLDPLLPFADDDTEYSASYGDEEDDLGMALRILRTVFPDIYAGAVQHLWRGAGNRTMEHYICEGVNRHLVTPLDCLDAMRYGVPIEPLGLGVGTPEQDFFTAYPDLALLLADFGITPDSDGDDYQRGYTVAKEVIRDLEPHTDAAHRHLSHLVAWLWGCSGNTLVDYDTEALWEMGLEHPDWTEEDIAFINEVARESQDIVADARAAQHRLETDAAHRAAFRHNLEALTERITAHDDKSSGGLDWSLGTQADAPRSAEDDPDVLQLRRAHAPTDGRRW
jgi:hypothetical protein